MTAVVYSHHHLNVSSIEPHERFWVDALGGTATKIGTVDAVKFPGVLVLLRQQAPTGGTKGTTLNHVGFHVRDLRQAIDRVKRAGFPMVTREEVASVPPEAVRDDVAYVPNMDAWIAMTVGPDGMKVELTESPDMHWPISHHHLHMFSSNNMDQMRDWYVKMFNATASTRGRYQTAELPGVSLTFANSATFVVGTAGRTVDHIAFEVNGLETFTRELEMAGVAFDRRFREASDQGGYSALLTDPWGTSVELTEGLNPTAVDR
jgi:hypothetical protein